MGVDILFGFTSRFMVKLFLTAFHQWRGEKSIYPITWVGFFFSCLTLGGGMCLIIGSVALVCEALVVAFNTMNDLPRGSSFYPLTFPYYLVREAVRRLNSSFASPRFCRDWEQETAPITAALMQIALDAEPWVGPQSGDLVRIERDTRGLFRERAERLLTEMRVATSPRSAGTIQVRDLWHLRARAIGLVWASSPIRFDSGVAGLRGLDRSWFIARRFNTAIRRLRWVW